MKHNVEQPVSQLPTYCQCAVHCITAGNYVTGVLYPQNYLKKIIMARLKDHHPKYPVFKFFLSTFLRHDILKGNYFRRHSFEIEYNYIPKIFFFKLTSNFVFSNICVLKFKLCH